jgi:Sec23/Sec24 trunk domain
VPLDTESGLNLPINYLKKPELYNAAYEFIVGEGFANKPPSDPTYLFVIDVTKSAIETGATAMAISAIKHAMKGCLLDGNEDARVGLICFDSKIHLISLNPTAKKPRILTMVGNFDKCPYPLSRILMSSNDFTDLEVLD